MFGKKIDIDSTIRKLFYQFLSFFKKIFGKNKTQKCSVLKKY